MRCQAEDCILSSEVKVYSREMRKVIEVCECCLSKVLDEGSPEYTICCKNCSCWQGVN